MKKLTLLIVLFLTLGLTATFALDVEAAWAGTGTLTWGIDLNNNSTGFQNAYTGSVKLLFLDAADATASGEGAVYGWIELLDGTIALTADDAATGTTLTAPAVTAKIMMDPVWIQIYSEPDMLFDWAADAEGLDDGVDNGAYAGGQGFTLGGAFAPVDFALYVVSENDWTANAANGYAFGATAGVTVGPVAADVYGVMGQYAAIADDPIGFGASADLTLAFGSMGLVVGVDADIMSAAASDFEVAAGTDLNLAYNDDGDVITSLNVDFSYSADTLGDADLKVAFSEASGFVPNLTFGADLTVGQLLTAAAMCMDINVSGSYDIDGIVPGFAVGYDMGLMDTDGDEVFDVNVYLTLGGLVPLTTFTLDYTTAQMLDAKATAKDSGVVTFETVIAYE